MIITRQARHNMSLHQAGITRSEKFGVNDFNCDADSDYGSAAEAHTEQNPQAEPTRAFKRPIAYTSNERNVFKSTGLESDSDDGTNDGSPASVITNAEYTSQPAIYQSIQESLQNTVVVVDSLPTVLPTYGR